MKQVFKNRQLTRTKTVNNILSVFDLTSEQDRHDWYNEAYKWGISCLFAANISATEQQNINKICGVMAALSPVKTWDDNKKIALDFLLTEDCGHMALFKGKAYAILYSDGEENTILDILNGNKIKAFYMSIRYPHLENDVTIDRHALRIALKEYVSDKEYAGMTDKQYGFFSECYKVAAKKRGVSPLIVQSATWIYLRNNKQMFNN